MKVAFSSKQASAEAKLSILFGVDSFAYLRVTGNEVRVESEPYMQQGDTALRQKIQMLLSQADVGGVKTNAFWFSPENVFIPQRLFDLQQPETYLSAVTGQSYGDKEVHATQVTALDSVLVYTAPSIFEDMSTLGEPGHVFAPLLKGFSQESADKGGGYQYLLYFRGRYVCTVLLEKGKLLMCQAQRFESARDALYFALLPFEQFSMSPSETPVYVCGQLMINSEIHQLLERYFTSIRFMGVPEWMKKYTLAEPVRQQAYLYYDLFCTLL